MTRRIIILTLILSWTDGQSQLNKSMNIITGMNPQDSISFSIRRVDCDVSNMSPFAFYKIVKWDNNFFLSYRNDTIIFPKIKLTAEQVNVLSDLEKKIKTVGSTTYDEYAVKKGSRTISRARDIKYSEKLAEFFR